MEGEKLRRQRREPRVGRPIRSATSPGRCVQGEDFDLAVLGISVAALPAICEELIKDRDNPGFRTMIDNSHTVMTQAFQLWLNRPLAKLGWPFTATRS